MKNYLADHPTADLPEALPGLTKAEKHQLLEEFNNTAVDYPRDITVIDLFEKQVQLNPLAIAVTFEEQQLTYKAINEYANQLAHYLRSKGIIEETLVPICIERSPQMIIGVLGILKAGGAYVPVDPDYPAERIQFMLEDTRATIVVSSSICKAKLQYSGNLDVIELDEELSIIQHQPQFNIETRIE